MQTYLDLLTHILKNGELRPNRTGVDTIGLFGAQARFNLREGFQLLTTKKMHFRGIAEELFWFLSGDTNARTLQEKGVNIWNEWATAEKCAVFGRAEGDLGPVYGFQWRNFGGDYEHRGEDLDLVGKLEKEATNAISSSARDAYMEAAQMVREAGFTEDSRKGVDQIAWLVKEITKNPGSRRLILSGWSPKDAETVALPPCHCLCQFYVQNGRLSCHLYQRSADLFLGVPYNLASYALLIHMLAYVTGLEVGDFIHTFGDIHIYVNHLEQVQTQLSRAPHALPKLRIQATTEALATPEQRLAKLLSLRYENLVLEGYTCEGPLKAEVAV